MVESILYHMIAYIKKYLVTKFVYNIQANT